jgi:multiple sugar transport system substrate-binding protein
VGIRGVTSKAALLSIATVGVVAYLFVPVRSKWTPPGPDVKIIQFWHGWTGEYADTLARVVAEFNRQHPRIRVQPLFMPTGAGENMKFFTAVAGEVPPDVIVVDGTQVASWGNMGVLRPLDDFLAEAGITKKDYFEPAWNQCVWDRTTYALSAAVDPNFALIWNKHHFRQAGLDPEKPPATIKELEEYTMKLTQWSDDGQIDRLGFLPTYAPHGSIAVLTWGWAFGGEFYNPETEEFTCTDPRIVEAMDWIIHLQDRFGGQEKILNFEQGFGFGAQTPFNQRDLSMCIAYVPLVQDTVKFAPDLEFGIGPMPKKEGVALGSEWVGGWTMAIPKSKRGNDKEAFELIRWMCASDEGTRFVASTMKLLPAYRNSPFFKEDIHEDPVLVAFHEILKCAERTRPITPANAQYMNELLRALGQSRNKKWPPAEALQRARDRITKEWTRIKTRTDARLRVETRQAGLKP